MFWRQLAILEGHIMKAEIELGKINDEIKTLEKCLNRCPKITIEIQIPDVGRIFFRKERLMLADSLVEKPLIEHKTQTRRECSKYLTAFLEKIINKLEENNDKN